MADLIDRAAANAALEKLDELMRHRAETEDKEFVKVQVGITLARCEIDAIPTVAAAPVVHCRECTKFATIQCPMHEDSDEGCIDWNNGEDYCSWGIRMDADAPERGGEGLNVRLHFYAER